MVIRAYNKTTGDVLAEIELPIKASGAPMSYFHLGHQYIVIAVATAEQPAELVALALPQALTLITQASAASDTGTQRVVDVSTLTPDELARAGSLYAAQCAVCHGAQGQGTAGGTAPSLRNARDQQQVRAMINNGAVEMPAFALRLAADDIELLSRYVSEGALVPPDLVPPVEQQ